MNPADIFSSVGSTMRPNENGYNRRGNRTYVQNSRTENSEIDLASIFLSFSASCAWPFLHSLLINLRNGAKIIYFAVNNEGSNKYDYLPNPRELLPWRFNIPFGLKIRWQLV